MTPTAPTTQVPATAEALSPSPTPPRPRRPHRRPRLRRTHPSALSRTFKTSLIILLRLILLLLPQPPSTSLPWHLPLRLPHRCQARPRRRLPPSTALAAGWLCRPGATRLYARLRCPRLPSLCEHLLQPATCPQQRPSRHLPQESTATRTAPLGALSLPVRTEKSPSPQPRAQAPALLRLLPRQVSLRLAETTSTRTQSSSTTRRGSPTASSRPYPKP